MSQIAKSLLNGSEEGLEQIVNNVLEEQLRTRVRASNAREKRSFIKKLPKRDALLSNAIAPGVDVARYLGLESIGRRIDYPMQ